MRKSYFQAPAIFRIKNLVKSGNCFFMASSWQQTVERRLRKDGSEDPRLTGGNVWALCKEGRLKEALHILDLMDEQGILPCPDTFIHLLQGCIDVKSLTAGKQVHSRIIKCGIKPDIFLGNFLVNMYAKCGSLLDAHQAFNDLRKPDVKSWTLMISGYAQHGRGEEALKLFQQMEQESVQPDEVTFISVLKVCARMAALEHGKRIHADIIKGGFESDTLVGSTLVDMYAKCGSIERARQVFDRLPKRNVVTWTVMVAAYASHGYGYEALSLFWQMQQEGVKPDKVTFISILKACASPAALECGKKIHTCINKRRLDSDITLGNSLIDMYAKCGSIDHARKVFNRMPKRDVFSWTSLIAGYTQHGHGEAALELFLQMQWDGVKPNKVTFMSVLKTCASLAVLEQGKKIHAHIIKSGFESDVSISNTLIDMYAKCGVVEHAFQVFEKMPNRDVVSWTVMVAGYTQHGSGEEALQLFWQMQQESVKLDKIIFLCVLKACANLMALEQGKRIHALIIKSGFESDAYVRSALIDMYAKCQSIHHACQMFNAVCNQDVVSWTAMIAGYAQNDHDEEALDLFWQMQAESVKLDQFVFASVLKACAGLAALEQGKQIHAFIVESGFELDVIVGNSLVDMYAKCGSIEHARQVFDKIPKWDVISWNAMIAGYAQHRYGTEALQLFWQMQQESVMPDVVTFVCALKACAGLAAMEQGKQIHACIIKSGFESNVSLGNGLIDMYAKCGNVKYAQSVFDNMSKRDTVSWTAMVAGYAQHGHGEEALQIVERMQLEGVNLNDITFIGILSACSHAGLVDEGYLYFDSMNQVHCITPTVEHYACMIDLLGRAGHLEEADNFIKKMPFQPSAIVWGSLLGACRVHGHVELAKRVAECILELQLQNAMVYVLLSNIFAALTRWDDKAKVRKMMEDRGIEKQQGCSWIEVNHRVHLFVTEDMSHPQMKEIHVELKRLSGQMVEAGYVPDVHCVLHNVEVEHKEFSLSQ